MATLAEWDTGALPVRTGGEFSLGNFDNVWPIDWINIDHNGSGAAQLKWDLGDNQSIVSLRLYFRCPPVWPRNTNQFASFEPESSPISLTGLAFAGETNGGQLRLVADGGSQVLATSPVELLLPSRWYRYSLMVNYSAQTTRARVWHLHTADGSPLWDSGVINTGVPTVSTARILNVGAVQGSLLLGHVRMAHMRVTDTTTMVARDASDTYPWSPPEGDYSQIRIISGGALINPSSVQLWDYGGRLVPAVSALYSAEVVEPEPEPDPVGVILATQTFNTQTLDQPLTLPAPWGEIGSPISKAFVASSAASPVGHGGRGARLSTSVSWRTIQYIQTASSNIRCIDFYVNFRNLVGNTFALTVENGATTISSIQIRSTGGDGTVRLRDGSVAVEDSVTSLSEGIWYRFALLLTPNDGQFFRAFQGESLQPLFELSGPLSSTTWDEANFGLATATDGTSVDYDTIRIARDGWLEPYA